MFCAWPIWIGQSVMNVISVLPGPPAGGASHAQRAIGPASITTAGHGSPANTVTTPARWNFANDRLLIVAGGVASPWPHGPLSGGASAIGGASATTSGRWLSPHAASAIQRA